MKPFELTEELKTGLPDIDEQHRVFFAWGNRILRSPDLEKDREAFANAVGFLWKYAMYHFAAEEFAMKLFAFPGLEVHRARHATFKARTAGLQEQARVEGLSHKVQLAVYFLIQDWFPHHILTMDRQFVEHLKASDSDPAPRLPDEETLRGVGVIVPDEEEVRVVRIEGEMTPAEMNMRARARSGM